MSEPACEGCLYRRKQLKKCPELIDGDPGLEKNCLERFGCKSFPGVYRDGDDNVALWMIEIMMTSPDANPLKTGSLESTDRLLAGGSREFHIPALPAFTGTETSTGIGFPSFLATSIYPAIASSICASASSQVDPSLTHPGRDGTVTVYPPSSFCSIRTV